jgi:glycosyltransferase involved in cell wall biosynthesis
VSRPKPRVAHVLHGMVVAGAETLVHAMAQRMGDEFEFSILTLDAIGPLGEDLLARGIPVEHLGRSPGVDFGLMGRIRRQLRARRIDLVHAHQYTPWFYGTLGASLSWGRPRIVFTEHGRHYPDVRSPKRVAFNRLLAPLTDELVAVSGFVKTALETNEGLPAERVRVLYNGIDPSQFGRPVDVPAKRREQGVGEKDPVIGIAARVASVKDHATLLRAFGRVRVVRPDAKLVLAGDGELRGDLEALGDELNLGESVRFLGVRRDVPELLATWDVFCLSSLSEGTSVTLLEAMAAGLPTVVTDVGGNPEIVEHGATGLLAPRGDDAGLADAMLALLADPQRRRRMGEAGRERVTRLFTLDRMIEDYRRLYRDVLSGLRT